MDKYVVEITDEALADMDRIYNYIANILLAPEHKKRTEKTLENKGFLPFFSCFCRLFVA